MYFDPIVCGRADGFPLRLLQTESDHDILSHLSLSSILPLFFPLPPLLGKPAIISSASSTLGKEGRVNHMSDVRAELSTGNMRE